MLAADIFVVDYVCAILVNDTTYTANCSIEITLQEEKNNISARF